jgi:PTH1 family peptidyl-tRNA hydrolase
MNSDSPMILVAGLGNPGPRYANTRHNLGFMAVEALAGHYQASLSLEQRNFNCRWGKTRVGSRNLILALPQTFMNLSGHAVRALASYFRVETKDIIVVHDDLDLDFGRIKISLKRGAAGHRGVASLLDCLDSDDFARLRLGIGRPLPGEPVEGYVLHEFYPQQQAALAEMLSQAGQCLISMIEQGVDKAMGIYNRR